MNIRILPSGNAPAVPPPLADNEIQLCILPVGEGKPLLRRYLSAHTGIPERELCFQIGAHGKPYLRDARIQFNLSHSGDYAALAFCASRPVGIDIEHVRGNARMEAIVSRFFHPDEAELFSGLTAGQQQDFFYRRWTVREAFLKGIGTGFALSPSSFCVSGPDGENFFHIKKSREDYSSWLIQSVPAPGGYYCSVAYPIP